MTLHTDFKSERLQMKLINQGHAALTYDFLQDPQLYRYLPQDPPERERLEERYRLWESRSSPDESEYWLNWVIFLEDTCIGTVQAGVDRATGEASIAYLIATPSQGRGFGSEAANALLEHLTHHYQVTKVKAWIDTRNVASIRLVEKLGMQRVELIEKADHFKGADSDEFVYQKSLSTLS